MAKKIPGEVTEREPFIQWEFVVKETFSLELLYKRLQAFLAHEEWKDLQQGKDDYETLYSEQIVDGGGKNLDIWWRAYKEPTNSFGDSLLFYVKIDMKTIMMVEKEFMHEGKKLKLDNGEFKANVSFYLHFNHDDDNPNNPWSKNTILKLFKNWFWKRLQEPAVDEAQEELVGLSNDIYELLQVYTTVKKLEGPQDFVPIRGVSN